MERRLQKSPGPPSGAAVQGTPWRPRGAVVDRLTVRTACESLSYMHSLAVGLDDHGGRARWELGGSVGGVMLALRTLWVSSLVSAPLLLTGCNAILWGNLGVLCVTVGIFLGTVFLSRSSAATRSAAARSNASAAATPSVAPPA